MSSIAVLLALVLLPQAPPPVPPAAAPTIDVVQAFEDWTGARLVFTRKETPSQVLYATTPTLSPERRREAAEILYRHAHNYPKGTFKKIGLTIVAVFAGCGDPEGDGFRPWVDSLKGYRYFGRWHAVGAIAACYYDDGQLPLTFHHEVFHHIDATRGGKTDYVHFNEDDTRFADAFTHRDPYSALALDARTIASLREGGAGNVLEDAVGEYAQKSAGEDQAETARWFQTNLADGLLQAALRPELAGSQRILHLLAEYQKAAAAMSPTWFVTVALEAAAGSHEAQKRRSEPVFEQTRDNVWLDKVDQEIDDPDVRRAIRRVQPATVRIGNGSGVNIDRSGLILTAGHVCDAVGDRFNVAFPDGRRFTGVTVASDSFLDLGFVRLENAPDDLPIARLAAAAPLVGDTVVVIGQPGSRTPQGELTNYEPWHVSVGEIRGFLPNILGRQSLGRTKHSAWTYWGHSGSPLFDMRGRIVALHNSWDSKTAMRHAVPWEAITKFLSEH